MQRQNIATNTSFLPKGIAFQPALGLSLGSVKKALDDLGNFSGLLSGAATAEGPLGGLITKFGQISGTATGAGAAVKDTGRELTGMELNDPDVHFNLQLATRAWGTMEALRGEHWPPPTGDRPRPLI